MFVGHYGIALAMCSGRRTPPLAAGFLAVQVMDFGFFGLSLAGVERWRPAPELAGLNPFALTFMPYTHGLVGASCLGAVCGIVAAILAPSGHKALWGLAIGLMVISHWGLDFLVHRPDLPLLADSGIKLGLGLWNHPLSAMVLEMAVLFAGLFVYSRRTLAKRSPLPLIAMTVGLLVLQAVNWFGPPITGAVLFPVAGLAAYFVATILAGWNDRTRSPA